MTDDPHALLQRPTISVEEFATLFQLSRNGAYAAIKRGDFPAIRIGRALRVPTMPLRRALEGGLSAPKVPALTTV
jgi:hypothetical protein